MKHIVSYSGGLASFFEAKLTIEKYGKDNVDLVFCDTLTEDEDLYRFIKDTENYLDKKVIVLTEGRDIWECAFDDNFLYNSRVANCSPNLKMKPFKIHTGIINPQDKTLLEKYVAQNYNENNVVIHIGFDYTELHRFEKSKKHYLPIKIESLIKDTTLTKMNMQYQLEHTIGIKLPLLYRLGFAHNNCGGFCFKAGIGHFKQLYDKLPNRFIYHMNKEQELIKQIGKEVSILKRVRNGKKINLTLKMLKEEFESNTQLSFMEEFDFGGCNCFIE